MCVCGSPDGLITGGGGGLVLIKEGKEEGGEGHGRKGNYEFLGVKEITGGLGSNKVD